MCLPLNAGRKDVEADFTTACFIFKDKDDNDVEEAVLAAVSS